MFPFYQSVSVKIYFPPLPEIANPDQSMQRSVLDYSEKNRFKVLGWIWKASEEVLFLQANFASLTNQILGEFFLMF